MVAFETERAFFSLKHFSPNSFFCKTGISLLLEINLDIRRPLLKGYLEIKPLIYELLGLLECAY